MEAELRKEYAEIAEAHLAGCADHVRERGYAIVTACQQLADRPPRELTASEKYDLWLSCYDGQFNSAICKDGSEVVDRIIAGYLKRQREPQVVKFRAARNREDGQLKVVQVDLGLNEYWEWLEPAQEFEVRT